MQSFSDEGGASLALGRAAAGALADLLDPEHVPLNELVDLVEGLDANHPGQALFEAVTSNEPLNVDVVRAFLVLFLRTWDDGGRTSLLNVWRLPPLVGEEAASEQLRTAFEAAADLAALGTPLLEDADLPTLCERMDRLAADGQVAGHGMGAAALWLPAAQLMPDDLLGAGYAFHAAEAASRAGEPEVLAVAASIRATRLLRAVDRNDGPSLVLLFDAVDSALRHLAACERPDEDAYGQLAVAFRTAPAVQSLMPMMLAVFAVVQQSEASYPIELVRPMWTLSLQSMIEELSSTVLDTIPAEIARERLGADVVDDSFALASWATWSFDHPYYRRAVPHGASMERERDVDISMLVLRHESTHVLSMVGGLGLAVMALRAAVVELELDLWAFYQRSTAQEFADSGVAALGEPNPPTIAIASWQTDLLAKIQVLQDVWNPWFEGIAVFSELADDPTADDDDTIVGDLMTQLIDRPPESASVEERRAALAATRLAFERQFVSIQERLGPERLQYYYWETAGPKYVGGYLAVRAVVASWRARAGPMSGHAAMRHLLHLTRFATSDSAVPALSLPPDEFADAAVEAMLSWVRGVANIDAGHLRFAEESPGSFRWVGLRPLKGAGSLDEATTTVDVLYRERMDEALQPAMAVGRPATLTLAEELLEAWSSVMTVMPIGRATARFWVNRTTQHLVYLVRVTEHRYDTGEPSYDVGSVPLEEDEIAGLEIAMVDHPFDRLTVFRFVDLASGIPDRQAAMNVIVFKLGDWIHVQLRGWQFGTSEVTRSLEYSVRTRLVPPTAVRMEAALIDAGEGAASRTAVWLNGHEVGAAAARVRDHDGSARERDTSRRLVELVLRDSELAEKLLDKGLRALVPYEVRLRSAAYRVLHASGREPAPAADLDLAEDHPLLALLACGAGGWDVVPITERSDEEPA
ncbi:hypothetical protein [Paractinoplanes rishiriensis]|uniref:hypothetical protein n=1 Tax=Paractinoplanes rishiriensis TaxID=1050105 RepID=UPI00194361C8|nr:hypothetical protein [Actinoplanes rishiriensis]